MSEIQKKSLQRASLLELNSAQQLARRICASPRPEDLVRTLPAQTLLLAVQALGVHDAMELIEAASPEQYRAILDFEMWHRDAFVEESFWQWLDGIDDPASLRPLDRFLYCFDKRLIALILQRHVSSQINEEPSEVPPGAGWYSPDHGYSWVRINLTDPEKHRLLGRVLAMIFEQNPEMFYQLLAMPSSTTTVELEEEAYEDRLRRMLDEGIPDAAAAAGVQQPLAPAEAARLLKAGAAKESIEYRHRIEPIVYEAAQIEPLSTLLRSVAAAAGDGGSQLDELQSELTLLANAGIVSYGVPVYDQQEAALFIGKIRGAANIGLEKALQLGGADALSAYRSLGLVKLYKLGLGLLKEVSAAAQSIPEQSLSAASGDQAVFFTAAALRQPFPVLPRFFNEDGNFDESAGKLEAGYRPFEHLPQLSLAKSFLRQHFGM